VVPGWEGRSSTSTGGGEAESPSSSGMEREQAAAQARRSKQGIARCVIMKLLYNEEVRKTRWGKATDEHRWKEMGDERGKQDGKDKEDGIINL